jgi:hypothetical protein
VHLLPEGGARQRHDELRRGEMRGEVVDCENRVNARQGQRRALVDAQNGGVRVR